MQDSLLKVTGEVEFILKDPEGNVKQQFTTHNAVVDAGKNFIASRMKDATSTVMTHMAVGSSSDAVLGTQNALIAPLGAREALDSTTVTSNQVKYTSSFEAGEGTGQIQEAGIFTALTGGNMLCRTVFNPINKDSADSLTINWTITINAA